MMDPVIRRWLSGTPVLLTAYLVWRNRTRQRRTVEILVTLALFMAWTAAVSLYVRADRAAAISLLARFHRHDLFLSTMTAIVSAVLVSRRRALNQCEAPRAWTAALPVRRSLVRWQAIAVESVPAVVLACILAAAFGGLSLVALSDAGLRAPILAWAATTGGVVLGAGLSFLLPSARQDEIYEDSRYVPHRRRAETPIPTGSLSALGSWPLRQTFASAKPKTIARVLIPILLAVPLGSQAADVMVAIGLFTALGSVVALVAAVISVSARASRWLEPLPLDPALFARRTVIPALASMCCATVIACWLIWVLGSSIARSLTAGVLILAACVFLSTSGCVLAIRASNKGKNGRI